MTCTACSSEMREEASRCPRCGARPGDPPPGARPSSGRLQTAAVVYPKATRTGATVWQVLTDKPHTIELELSQLTGREVVVLDGRELVNKIKWGLSSEHRIPLGGRSGVLTVGAGLGGPTVGLTVDGHEVAPVSTATFVQPKAAPAPAWAYVFAAACLAVPLVTMGGAIPAGLGFGGAAGCMATARNQEMSVGARVGLCVLITAGVWIGFVILLVVVIGLQSR